MGFAGDGGEGHGAVVRGAAEDGFGEGAEADFLPEEGLVGREEGGFGQVVFGGGEGGEVAAVEGEEEVAEPGVRGRDERVEDGVQEELAEIVDGFRDEGGDAKIVRAGLRLGGGQGGEVDAGKVQKGGFVVGAKVLLCLVCRATSVFLEMEGRFV